MIADLLEVGEENAKKSEELMELTGTDRRGLQARVAREREEGALIGASKNGYFLLRGREEAERYYQHATKAARKLFRTMRHIKSFAFPGLPEGQEELDLTMIREGEGSGA